MPSIRETVFLTESAVKRIKTPGIYRDQSCKSLLLRVGARGKSFVFYFEGRRGRQRIVTERLIGHYPVKTVADARIAATIMAGKVAAKAMEPSRREAIKFDEALEQYLEHLKAKAAAKDKPARWHRNVEQLSRQLLRPKWSEWTLLDMSRSPGIVADWHSEVSMKHGLTYANRAAQVLRASYKRAARRDPSLPAALPTAAITFNSERPRQVAIAFDKFPAWYEAWTKIVSPTRRAYHLAALLTGTRPGELARLKWADVTPRKRMLTIRNAKGGTDITIPMTIEIVKALRLSPKPRTPDAPVFPGSAHNPTRDCLPAFGNALRHTYKTVAVDCGVDDLISHFLMGHAPEGVSQKYIAKLILVNGPAIRDAQRRISRRVMSLLVSK